MSVFGSREPKFTPGSLESANIADDLRSKIGMLVKDMADTRWNESVPTLYDWAGFELMTFTTTQPRRDYETFVFLAINDEGVAVAAGKGVSAKTAEVRARIELARETGQPLPARGNILMGSVCPACGGEMHMPPNGQTDGMPVCNQCGRWEHGVRTELPLGESHLTLPWPDSMVAQFKKYGAEQVFLVVRYGNRGLRGLGQTTRDAEQAAFDVYLSELGAE